MLLKTALSITVDFLFPERCILCRRPCSTGFCTNCQELLPRVGARCTICSTSLPDYGTCGRCLASRPAYGESVIPFRYQPPISSSIHALKYNTRLDYAPALAKMLCWQIRKSGSEPPDVLVPMPLHPARIRHRGFNQAMELARVTGRELAIPVKRNLLVRVKNTVTQTGLNEKMRQTNMANAFVATGSRLPRHIALVDDVVTTGATLAAAARACLAGGAHSVTALAAARTPLPGEREANR